MTTLITSLLLTAQPSLERPCDATKGRTWQASYRPSFHQPLVVTLEVVDGRAVLEVLVGEGPRTRTELAVRRAARA